MCAVDYYLKKVQANTHIGTQGSQNMWKNLGFILQIVPKVSSVYRRRKKMIVHCNVLVISVKGFIIFFWILLIVVIPI